MRRHVFHLSKKNVILLHTSEKRSDTITIK